MRPYRPDFRLDINRAILLLAGSLIVGIGVGAAAYFVSTILYIIIGFPLIIAFAALWVYERWVLWTQVRYPKVITLVGIFVALLVMGTFFTAPYLAWRAQRTQALQTKYNVDAATAAQAVDDLLTQSARLPGVLGYYALRAQEGVSYSNYVMLQGVSVPLGSFNAQGGWAWMMWLLEAALVIGVVGWLSGGIAEHPYNRSAGQWYNTSPRQIATAEIDCQALLVHSLNIGDLTVLKALLQPKDRIDHPQIELYSQMTRRRPAADRLLTVKATKLNDEETEGISREDLGQWEVTAAEYEALMGG